MLAALPCQTVVCKVHAAVGFVIVAGWLLLFLFGLIGFLARREPGRSFWGLLGLLQALLVHL